jgi:hypothetical protein
MSEPQERRSVLADIHLRRRDHGRRGCPTLIRAPHWKKAEHFNQCYGIILEAHRQHREGIAQLYVDWITFALGTPYDDMIAWASQNGWPEVRLVWTYGWR